MRLIRIRVVEIYCVTYKRRTGLASNFYIQITVLERNINARDNVENLIYNLLLIR